MAEPVTPEAPILPWPRTLRQSWLKLSFLHWAVEPASIAHLYPPDTEPDICEGRSFVGMVPFQMTDTGFARGPAFLGTFLETNIRLYSVDRMGRRGVVFLSLDTNRLDMVAAGRWIFGVPYRWARMGYQEQGDRRTYASRLRRRGVAPSSFVEVKVGDALTSGPLEHFLTARWGVHLVRVGRTWYLPNEHSVWPLRRTELIEFSDDGLLASVGLGDLGRRPPDHVAYSEGVAAKFGLPVRSTTPRAIMRPAR